MKKNGNEYTIQELVNSFTQKYKLTSKINKEVILSSWAEISGPMVSKHTKRIDVIEHKLYIEIDEPALKNELLFMREKIAIAVNNYLKQQYIEEVIIR